MMRFEKSCGVVIFTHAANEIRYVLAQSKNGHFGFPKGHVENLETEEETALREVFEEVHLKPTLLPGFREVSEYDIPNADVRKQVVFFLGSCASQKIVVQKTELLCARLVSYEEAMRLLKYEDDKRILTKARQFLRAGHGKDCKER